MLTASVITCSDKGFKGLREDESGEYIKNFLIIVLKNLETLNNLCA